MNLPFDNQLAEDVQTIWLRESLDRPPEELIWHYTKNETLPKLLKSNRLRATHFKHLNDSSEFQYGKDLVDEAWGRRNFEPRDFQTFCEVRKNLDLFSWRRDAFVFCASTECDDEFQWNRYGEKGKGYSLGLISSRLHDLRITKPHDLRWCRVEYDRQKQLDELGEVIDCYCSHLRRVIDPNPAEEAERLAYHLILFLCRFKEARWEPEKEWRLIYAPELDKPLEIKVPESGVPHVDLSYEPFGNGEPGELPIREAMYGPACDPQLAKGVLDDLLRCHGYLSVHPSSSAIQRWPVTG